MELTRRNFIQSAAATGAIVAMAGLTACGAKQGDSQATASTATEEKITPSETIQADIVVIGGGMSGLAAAVSAGESNKKVVLLEASKRFGGNGLGTEGIFALGSSMQKEAGIDFTFSEIIGKEMEFFNYRINSLYWKDMVDKSASNIDWLISNGVLIDHVDDYRGMGTFAGFHWWGGFVDDGIVSKDGALNGYITPMGNKLEEQGVEVHYETRARKLIMENGAVAGVYASQSDGSWLQIDCKAVIIATGGYADNDEKLVEVGVDIATLDREGYGPHHQGDGLDMALSAGGVDTRAKHCMMREPGVVGYEFPTALGAMGVRLGGPYLFVNENGERFTNENCTKHNQAYMANTIGSQKKCFAILNQKILEELDATQSKGIAEEAKKALDGDGHVWTANSLDEIASKIGVDAKTFAASVERYNSFCSQGNDEDYGKDPATLIAIQDGPFWAFEAGLFYFTSLGGIATNRNFEVVDANDEAIPGLWAVGVDGCELYRETYTVMVPASCMANNINSGRTAGQNAVSYCS